MNVILILLISTYINCIKYILHSVVYIFLLFVNFICHDKCSACTPHVIYDYHYIKWSVEFTRMNKWAPNIRRWSRLAHWSGVREEQDMVMSAVSSENSMVGGTDCLPLSFSFLNARTCVKFLDIALHWKFFRLH